MGFFHKDKGNPSTGKKDKTKQATDTPTRQSKKKGHTRRRQKSIIAKMKISESVPSTIIDAIHGDTAVINTDKDFVRAQALQFTSGIYYPVLVLDDKTLAACGLTQKANRDAYGQLSLSLKTSSGSSGLLPIATPDSLSANYIAILPMHDAFDILKSFDIFSDYKPGFVVGLLNIDDDQLTLRQTDMRLTMDQWWRFVTSEAEFLPDSPDDLTLRFSEDTPSQADALTVSEAEARGGNATDTTLSQASREFDDDDSGESSASAFAKGDDHADGFSPNDFGEFDEEDEEVVSDHSSAVDTPTDQATADNDNDQEAAPVDSDTPPVETPVEPAESTAPVPAATKPAASASASQSSDVAITSPDELEAHSLQLKASTLSMDDFDINISNKEFIDSFLTPLNVDLLPMLDTSDDPSGRLAYENKLRQNVNLKLTSALDLRRSRLNQWFESQRYSLLDSIRTTLTDKNSKLNANQKTVAAIQDELNDKQGIRQHAQDALQETFARASQDLASEKKADQEQAMAEIEKRYAVKNREMNQANEDLTTQKSAELTQNLVQQLNDVKQSNQRYAQTSASKIYAEIMDQAATQFAAAQKALSTITKEQLAMLDKAIQKGRQEENRRVEHDAEIIKHDATITNLTEQLTAQANAHEKELQAQKADFEAQLAERDDLSATEKQAARKEFDTKLSEQRTELANLREDLRTSQSTFSDTLAQNDEHHQSELKRLNEESEKQENAFTRQLRRVRGGYVATAILLLLLGGASGFAGGLYTHNSAKTQQAPTTVAVPYTTTQQQPVQQQQQSSSESSQSSSESSSSSQSSSSDKDKNQNKKSDKQTTKTSSSQKTQKDQKK